MIGITVLRRCFSACIWFLGGMGLFSMYISRSASSLIRNLSLITMTFRRCFRIFHLFFTNILLVIPNSKGKGRTTFHWICTLKFLISRYSTEPTSPSLAVVCLRKLMHCLWVLPDTPWVFLWLGYSTYWGRIRLLYVHDHSGINLGLNVWMGLQCMLHMFPHFTTVMIMINCVEFAYIWSRFFDVRNMKDLFDSVAPSTILLYVTLDFLF